MEHDVSGTISVTPDCMIESDNFSYDGRGPAVYFWAGKECTPSGIAKGGRISNTQLLDKYNGDRIAVPIRDDIKFEDVGCISVYCEEFSADFGHVSTKSFDYSGVDSASPTSPSSSPKPASPKPPSPSPKPPTSSLLYGLQNCQTLEQDYLNVFWTLEGDDMVKMALEGRPGPDDKWMAFGFSPPDSFGSIMVGSDVVVAGFVNDECFAYDYYLSAYEQCDFLTGTGVCPQTYINGSLDVNLDIPRLQIQCDRNGSYMSVYFERPLASVGGTWPTDGSSSAVYAMGPLTSESNVDRPVVLYHSLKLPGASVAMPFNAPSGQRLLIALDQSQNTCTSLEGLADDAGPSTAALSVPILSGTKDFIVTSGPYEVHPDPPGWGLAYIVNNVSLPVLNVVRGIEYTFTVMAGPTHPLYFTSSSVGAGALTDYANEVVYGGNDTTFGTDEEPLVFTWTPNDTTPDTLYYQCAIHQKIGWQIHVFDTEEQAIADASDVDIAVDNADNAVTGPMPGPADSVVLSEFVPGGDCVMDINGIQMFFQQCDTVSEVFGYNYAWNISAVDNDPSSTMLLMALNASLANNEYVSVAFPQQRDTMIESSAMVMSRSSGDVIALTQYYLSSQNQNGVQQSSQGLQVSNVTTSIDGSVAAGFFKAIIPIQFNSSMGDSTGNKRRLLLASTSLSDFNMLWSSGTTNDNGNPTYHGPSKGSIYLNLQSGLSVTSLNTQTLNMPARRAHMWLMAIGWGIIVPIGIVTARMKTHKSFSSDKSIINWFNCHRVLQSLGFAMGIAGIGCGFAVRGTWATPFTVHRDLGVTITVLGAVQVLSLVARPSIDSKARAYWGPWHRWIGRATAILAVSNIYYGMFDVADVSAWAWIVYTVILAIIVAVGLMDDIHQRCFNDDDDEFNDVSMDGDAMSKPHNKEDHSPPESTTV